jgi:DNA polymerase-3 subunit chi
MEIQFYHLLTTPVEVALVRLLPKVLAGGYRVVLLCTDAAQLEKLDEALWVLDADSFLPHGRAGEAQEADQPILLTTTLTNPNQAKLVLILNGVSLSENDRAIYGFDRVLDMFDGSNESIVAAARTRWKSYKEVSHTLTYYKQQQGGGWKQEG